MKRRGEGLDSVLAGAQERMPHNWRNTGKPPDPAVQTLLGYFKTSLSLSRSSRLLGHAQLEVL